MKNWDNILKKFWPFHVPITFSIVFVKDGICNGLYTKNLSNEHIRVASKADSIFVAFVIRTTKIHKLQLIWTS